MFGLTSRYWAIFLGIYLFAVLLGFIIASYWEASFLYSTPPLTRLVGVFYLSCVPVSIFSYFGIEMVSIFNYKVVNKLKRFTATSEGDLFPAGFYGRELDLQVVKAIDSIPFLFAMVMRRNGSRQFDRTVAYDYFQNRFHGSKRCSFSQTDETYLKSELDRCLNLPKLTDYRSPSLEVVKSKISYEARLELFDYLFKTAYVSGGVKTATHALLMDIAKFLLIKEWDICTLEFRYECYQEKKSDAQARSIDYRNLILARSYEKLGLDANASESDVKRAFRERVKNCHPDRIPENASQKEREEAVQLFRQTKESYEEICKASGYR